VFIFGSPRSGTTLLYHMLLSAGGFVRYRTETHVYNVLGPRFGGLKTAAQREGALEVWLASDCHKLSGLSTDEVREAVRRDVRCPGDFLHVVMGAMARRQGVARWAESTPAHAVHLVEIARELPNALFVHVVRDGRDVAASLAKQGWVRPLPFDRNCPVLAAAAYWSWLVGRGRQQGRRLGSRYIEVRYEDLVEAPAPTLSRLGEFLRHELNWQTIQRVGIGSVSLPNSSFPGSSGGFKGRWKSELSASDAASVDALLRGRLLEFGYASETLPSVVAPLRRAAYRTWFGGRDWVKRHTLLGARITRLDFYAPGSMRITADKLAGLNGPTAA
jgi:hypothetical protein